MLGALPYMPPRARAPAPDCDASAALVAAAFSAPRPDGDALRLFARRALRAGADKREALCAVTPAQWALVFDALVIENFDCCDVDGLEQNELAELAKRFPLAGVAFAGKALRNLLTGRRVTGPLADARRREILGAMALILAAPPPWDGPLSELMGGLEREVAPWGGAFPSDWQSLLLLLMYQGPFKNAARGADGRDAFCALSPALWAPVLDAFGLPEQVSLSVLFPHARAVLLARAPGGWPSTRPPRGVAGPWLGVDPLSRALNACRGDLALFSCVADAYSSVLVHHPRVLAKCFNEAYYRDPGMSVVTLLVERFGDLLLQGGRLNLASVLPLACRGGALSVVRWAVGRFPSMRPALRRELFLSAVEYSQLHIVGWLCDNLPDEFTASSVLSFRHPDYSKHSHAKKWCQRGEFMLNRAPLASVEFLFERFALGADLVALKQVFNRAWGDAWVLHHRHSDELHDAFHASRLAVARWAADKCGPDAWRLLALDALKFAVVESIPAVEWLLAEFGLLARDPTILEAVFCARCADPYPNFALRLALHFPLARTAAVESAVRAAHAAFAAALASEDCFYPVDARAYAFAALAALAAHFGLAL